ncbi:terpene cyclase/mutase family protein [Candidatus Woesearchaeota archaeon]|nr:terpene cyclase/mutase family protein [Candidatus Woesearchaeota archaeon]
MNLHQTITNAKHFLFSERDTGGLWRDFYTDTHGESIDWISAYVGRSLLTAGVSFSELEITASNLLDRQGNEGGWGYNEKIFPDADSTANVILFLSYFENENEISRAKRFLLRHQHPDGSFGTYVPKLIRKYKRIPEEMSIDGWCSGVPEITAVALEALGNNERAIAYLKSSQTEQGYWRSYWYTSDINSTTKAINSIRDKENCREMIIRARRWLIEQVESIEIPVYLAFLLDGIRGEQEYSGEFYSGIDRLSKMQKDDGSWESYPILRFPLPSNTEPWKNSDRWRKDSKDQNRLFTTATCLNVLSKTKFHI